MSAEIKSSFFKYLEESTWQERESIANELKTMYNRILDDEQEYFALVREEKKGSKNSHKYLEVVARLGTIQGIFEILHIDYEYGERFDLAGIEQTA
jgi:hypothetical protein